MKLQQIKIDKVLGFRGNWTIKVTAFDENNNLSSILIPTGKSKGKFKLKILIPMKHF